MLLCPPQPPFLILFDLQVTGFSFQMLEITREPLTWTRASVRSRRIASSSLKKIFLKERGREKRQRERKKRFKVIGPPLGSNVELLFCPLLLFTVNKRRPKYACFFFFAPLLHTSSLLPGMQKDAIAIFYFPCHEWVEIGLVIVRFSLAQACHCNNIMVEIMTSKLACHKAIDAPFSCEMGCGAN